MLDKNSGDIYNKRVAFERCYLRFYFIRVQVWRNGRRACLRGKWETVWVRLPPPAPKERLDDKSSFLFIKYLVLKSNPY